MLKPLRLLSILFGSLIASGVAQASSLEGKTLGFQILFPTISDVASDPLNGNYLVGPGVEIDNPLVTGNFSDTNLRADFHASFTYYAGYSFVGWHFFDVLGTIGSFTGASLNSDTNIIGIDASRITFDANNIWVNLRGLSVTPSTVVSIDVSSIPSSVPEPEAYSMLLAGLGLLGVMNSRSKQNATSV